MNEIRTLRPGVLVSLKTRTRGTVKYDKRDLEFAHLTGDGTQVSRWETEKTVFDAAEQKEASQVVSSASYLIRKLCVQSEHGLLCPDSRADQLPAAITAARELADQFNAGATYTRVEVNVICGRVVADDVEATRAIFSETERFLQQMQDGLQELDVKKVRAVMRKAKDVGQMLAPEANQAIASAVSVASAACRKIVKAGNQAAIAIDQNAINAIGAARNSFLDFDITEVEVDTPQIITPRGIDFADEPGMGYYDLTYDGRNFTGTQRDLEVS